MHKSSQRFIESFSQASQKHQVHSLNFSGNKRPCKIVPTIPILAPVGVEKNNALQEGRKNGSDMETTLLSEAEAEFMRQIEDYFFLISETNKGT